MDLFRTRGIAAAASLCVSATAMLVMFSAQPAHALSPTNPTEAALGFNIFTAGDGTLTSNETEGPVALGGNLVIGGNYQVGGSSSGTFIDTGAGDTVPSALVVDGIVDLPNSTAGSVLFVQRGAYAKVGDLTGVDVRNTDDNDATRFTRIVPDNGAFDATPRVELRVTQPIASVGPRRPIDFDAAFTQFRSDSTTLDGCTANVVLDDAEGDPLTLPLAAGTQAYITLTTGETNVLDITAADLDNLASLTFQNQPTDQTPLVVNVDTTGVQNVFDWTVANQAGIGGEQGRYILWNFPTATAITLDDGGATLEGTLYAPNADLTDLSDSNIEGQVIVDSIIHGAPGFNGGEVHYFPFSAALSCAGPASPGISTDASDNVTVGQPITDTATLSGGAAPTGFITFSAFGPDNAACAGMPVFTNSVAVTGNGDYTSANFIPTVPGTYRWIARYNGDDDNNPAITACDDPGESVIVSPLATPTLVTAATPPGVTLGGIVTDRATLSGGTAPTGSITFNLYGPNDMTCTGPVAATSTVPVSGNTDYFSAAFMPTQVGTYFWIASYTGDVNNAPVSGTCGAQGETVTVTSGGQTIPALSTAAMPATATVGQQVTDRATLSGGDSPTGTITFRLYGPDNATCAGAPVFTDTATVSGNGSYDSDPFTPQQAGTYRWIASYGGDRNNAAVSGECGDEGETVVVTGGGGPVTPTLTTEASRDTYVGKRIHDTATLSGGQDPTGTITFELYGPDDRRCSRDPVFTSTVDVDGNGDYRSEEFRADRPGMYQWVATYHGDDGNRAVSTDCGDPAEQVIVKKKKPYGGKPRP